MDLRDDPEPDRAALSLVGGDPKQALRVFIILARGPSASIQEEGDRLGMKDVIKIADLRQRTRYTNLSWHHDVIKATIRQELRAR